MREQELSTDKGVGSRVKAVGLEERLGEDLEGDREEEEFERGGAHRNHRSGQEQKSLVQQRSDRNSCRNSC